MSCRSSFKNFTSITYPMKTAWSSNFEWLWTFTVTWESLSGFEIEIYQKSWLRNLHYRRSLKRAQKKKRGRSVPLPLITHVKNNLHSIFSIVEVYNKNVHVHFSKGLFEHFFRLFKNIKGVVVELKRGLHFKSFHQEDSFDGIMYAPLTERFWQGEENW